MTDEQSRFRLTNSPELAPAIDLITGTSVGPFIDTGYDVPFAMRGRLYISLDTLREMARVAGLFEEGRSESENVYAEGRYASGYSDAVKENLGGDLRDIYDRLGIVAHWLAAVDGVPAEVEPQGNEPALVGAESKPAGDVSRAARPRGQGDGARGNNRPADVPSGASDVNPFRI